MEKDKDTINAEREKALELAIAKIKKEHGEGSIMRMSEEAVRKVDVIPTGCLPLDFALGIGGMPKGRIIEIYGPESSGKTTLTLHVIAQAQKMGGKVAFIDAEHALDPTYAKNLGIDLNELYISQPDSGEQALNIVEELVTSGALDVIVVDSVAALTPKAEIDGEMEDSQIGLQARLMSKALRKLVMLGSIKLLLMLCCNISPSCLLSSGTSAMPLRIASFSLPVNFLRRSNLFAFNNSIFFSLAAR